MLLNKIKFYGMRFATNVGLRDFLINIAINKIGGKLEFSGLSRFINSEENQHVQNIKRLGFTELDNKLQNEKLSKILDYAKKLICFDPFKRDLGEFKIANVPNVTHVANYRREDLIECPEIMEIANDPGILRIVQGFLGAKPTISNVNMWWSLGGRKEAKDAQLFHRDVDDFKFCKLFIYLTDVGENQGPHTYVAGSSSSSKLRKIRRYQDKEIIEVFGKEKIIKFVRDKGSMFIVDTYGFHKGTLPKDGNRLLLQIQYSLNPIRIENYQPVNIELKEGFNSYVNRLLINN